MADVLTIKYNTKSNCIIIIMNYSVCLKLAFDPVDQRVFGDKGFLDTKRNLSRIRNQSTL